MVNQDKEKTNTSPKNLPPSGGKREITENPFACRDWRHSLDFCFQLFL